jgi:hypothetical protein
MPHEDAHDTCTNEETGKKDHSHKQDEIKLTVTLLQNWIEIWNDKCCLKLLF